LGVKTLHLYLTRQILASLLMTVIVFTFVLLLGNVLKDVLRLLVNGQVGFGVLARAVGLLVPFVAVFALPMGTLAATLLIFGRFSADQEFTAVRASGVSLLSLITPILLLSLLLCGLSALVNMEIGPRCRVAFTTILFKLQAQLATAYLPEGRFITEFPGYIVYVGKNNNGDLKDVILLALQNETNVQQTVHAARGKRDVDVAQRKLRVTLYNGTIMSLSGEQRTVESFDETWVDLRLDAPQKSSLKVDDMTFRQLRHEMRDLEKRMRVRLPGERLSKEQAQAWKKEWDQWRRDLSVVIFHMHRQVAFSFACFGFTLVGIPLGLRVHRRETNIGIFIALVLVAIYYSFILVGQALNTRPEYAPYLIVWLPNFLFQAVGAFLLWRANRGV
jgi:lipopolysaccharide export system permease protein